MADYRTIETDKGDVLLAIRQGFAVGCREHIPKSLGRAMNSLAYLLPLCAFMAFTHFVLGADGIASVLFGGVGGAGIAAPKAIRKLSDRRKPPDDG